jgi:anhydro-N-acetylmuramic acid kinase
VSELYIGLMSGTSLDGIDTVLVDLSHPKPTLITSLYYPLESALRNAIESLRQPGFNEILRLAEIDVILGNEFGNAVNLLLHQQNLSAKHIRAIGSHGQTIRHQPHYPYPFTLQIGDPNIIAAKTGITTIADFRRRDIALGGQGAPLVPAFHKYLFDETTTNRIIVNIGGIANITLLPIDPLKNVLGFDTGPGNTLLDAWTQLHLQEPYDKNGQWAAQGTLDSHLLDQLLHDPYFNLPPPKSTGQDYFNLLWLKQFSPEKIAPKNVQTTLTELTARTIIDAIMRYLPEGEIYICGGGIHNPLLIDRIKAIATHHSVDSTEKLGIPPDWMEAMAFAWLAQQTLNKKPGNLKSVTGARHETILGGVYYCL